MNQAPKTVENSSNVSSEAISVKGTHTHPSEFDNSAYTKNINKLIKLNFSKLRTDHPSLVVKDQLNAVSSSQKAKNKRNLEIMERKLKRKSFFEHICFDGSTSSKKIVDKDFESIVNQNQLKTEKIEDFIEYDKKVDSVKTNRPAKNDMMNTNDTLDVSSFIKQKTQKGTEKPRFKLDIKKTTINAKKTAKNESSQIREHINQSNKENKRYSGDGLNSSGSILSESEESYD